MVGLEKLRNRFSRERRKPSQVGPRPFKVRQNLATTPGAVVFRDKMFELIQYKYHCGSSGRPIVITPPQINKFLLAGFWRRKRVSSNSSCPEGFQVFCISWRNPKPEHRDWGLEDYVDSVANAVDVACKVTVGRRLNDGRLLRRIGLVRLVAREAARGSLEIKPSL